MNKIISNILTLTLIASPILNYNEVQAEERINNNKVYAIVTGFTHIWGFAKNEATDGTIGDMPFLKDNYDIVTKTAIYDLDHKKVIVGFGDDFKDGNTRSLERYNEAFGIIDAKIIPYDPSLVEISEEKWSKVGISLATGHTVGFNATAVAESKIDYDEEYYSRKSNISNLNSIFNKEKMEISYSFTNTVPVFNYENLEDMNSQVIRLDKLARRSYGEINTLMTEYAGEGWETSYPEVAQRLKEAKQLGNEKLRGYMFFTPLILELTIDKKPELALADTLFQADKTSFTDISGTTRDRMEIYDINDNLVFGDTVNSNQQYKACSYLQNQGTNEIEKHELFLDAYMQTVDINNLNTSNHLKTYLETAFIDGTVKLGDKLQASETARYCTIFTAPNKNFRIEHQIPDYYIPGKDTKTTNNLAARILKVAEQDLAVTNISLEDSFKTNGTNTYTIDIAKILGNKEIKDVNTRITVKNADKKVIYDNTLVANKTLKLSDSYTYTISANNVNSNRNTVCATIDIKHHNSGDDEKLENSTLCQDFTGELDIFLSNFKINPGTIYQKDPKKTEKRTLDFSVDVNALGKTGIYNTNIVFKDASGKVIYKEDIVVSTHAKQVVTFSKELPLNVGANVFRAEVNLNPKKVAEFSKAANPYTNNVIESSTTLLFNKAANICSTNQNRSDFTITYTRTTVVANLETRYDSEGRRYTVCVQESETIETIPVDHYEIFKINGIMFRSKITKDAFIKEHDIKANVVKENEAWINMFTHNNKERDLLKIRAGMGYELKVETEYKHNFTDAPKPLTDVGDCGYSTVVPDAPIPSIPSERIRVSHEGDDRYITKATEIKKNENGEIRTYELRGANAQGTGAGDKFFVSENVKSGQKLTADVTLEDFDAYTGEVLCNRKSGYFTIDGHYSQDFITQIVQ